MAALNEALAQVDALIAQHRVHGRGAPRTIGMATAPIQPNTIFIEATNKQNSKHHLSTCSLLRNILNSLIDVGAPKPSAAPVPCTATSASAEAALQTPAPSAAPDSQEQLKPKKEKAAKKPGTKAANVPAADEGPALFARAQLQVH